MRLDYAEGLTETLGKTERAGQSFKHQLGELVEEYHIESETEFEAAVAKCCYARNIYCNR